MESALLGIGVVVLVGLVLAVLTKVNSAQQKRILHEETRPREVKRYDYQGDLLPAEEVSLGPVDYRRLPSADPAGYFQTTQQARHAPTLETSVIIPALTATGTAIALTLACGVLAWALGWSGKVVAITFALSLAGGWFWRLGFADKVLWSVESWSGKDLDHDHNIGRPALGYATINPGAARATVARQTAQIDTEGRTAALQAFVDVCYLKGTSESAHGVKASGPERDAYTACRDTLLSLGLARWKNPERAKSGWVMTTDPATCKGIVGNHVA